MDGSKEAYEREHAQINQSIPTSINSDNQQKSKHQNSKSINIHEPKMAE
jgi:hypothetical protein